MLYLPHDTTLRRERVAQLVAALLCVLTVAVSIIVVLVEKGSASRAVVVPAPSGTSSTQVEAGPTNFVALREQFPLPPRSFQVLKSVYVQSPEVAWQTHLSLAKVKAFYVARLRALHLTWDVGAIRANSGITGWSGVIYNKTASTYAIGMLRLETKDLDIPAGTVRITLGPL